MLRKLSITAIVGIAIYACYALGAFGPRNYNECLLEHLRGVPDQAVGKIVSICFQLFP
jgi:hypothetical protein